MQGRCTPHHSTLQQGAGSPSGVSRSTMRPISTAAGITRSCAARVIHQAGQALHGVDEFHSRRELANPWRMTHHKRISSTRLSTRPRRRIASSLIRKAPPRFTRLCIGCNRRHARPRNRRASSLAAAPRGHQLERPRSFVGPAVRRPRLRPARVAGAGRERRLRRQRLPLGRRQPAGLRGYVGRLREREPGQGVSGAEPAIVRSHDPMIKRSP
jgi:hypothetical protein